MIIGLEQSFPPDAVERDIADVAAARALIAERRPDVPALFERRRSIYRMSYGDPAASYLERAENATLLALARFGVRHGTFGRDFHAYHNEDHALEILDRRLGRVLGQLGVKAMAAHDWLAITLFASCHDLRQREVADFTQPIGNNEAASIAETHRILDIAGFDRTADQALYVALEIMIAGSTFDARPPESKPPEVERRRMPRPEDYNTAEVVATRGPLAPKLAPELDRVRPGWRGDPELVRAVDLALIASDLDTANVGESFTDLAESAARLAAEREMRSGRSLGDAASGAPVFSFLTGGQERYFFELHRFCSELGRRVYADDKERNAPRVRRLSAGLRERYADRAVGTYNGAEVLTAHLTLAEIIAKDGTHAAPAAVLAAAR